LKFKDVYLGITSSSGTRPTDSHYPPVPSLSADAHRMLTYTIGRALPGVAGNTFVTLQWAI